MINKLKINLPNDKFSGNAKRELVHKQLIIGPNLEMFQSAEIVYPEIQAIINSDDSLTARQKELVSSRFQAVQYSNETAGGFVNAKTGEEVLPDEFGNFPTGITVVSELQFWQDLPAQFFTAQNLKTLYPDVEFIHGDTLAALVYNGLLFSKAQMRERNRV